MSNPAVAQYHWHADYGMHLARPFIWKDSTGTAINNTGYTALLTIRQAYSTDPLLTATSGGGQITVGGANGHFDVSVDEDLMKFGSAFTDCDYVFDIVISLGGEPIKLIEGVFTLHPTAGR